MATAPQPGGAGARPRGETVEEVKGVVGAVGDEEHIDNLIKLFDKVLERMSEMKPKAIVPMKQLLELLKPIAKDTAVSMRKLERFMPNIIKAKKSSFFLFEVMASTPEKAEEIKQLASIVQKSAAWDRDELEEICKDLTELTNKWQGVLSLLVQARAVLQPELERLTGQKDLLQKIQWTCQLMAIGIASIALKRAFENFKSSETTVDATFKSAASAFLAAMGTGLTCSSSKVLRRVANLALHAFFMEQNVEQAIESVKGVVETIDKMKVEVEKQLDVAEDLEDAVAAVLKANEDEGMDIQGRCRLRFMAAVEAQKVEEFIESLDAEHATALMHAFKDECEGCQEVKAKAKIWEKSSYKLITQLESFQRWVDMAEK